MTKTIVAMFESRTKAEGAAEFLLREGFDRDQIDIRSEPWAEVSRERAGEPGSWWDWLFGQSDDGSYYSDGLKRGGAVLAVTADEEDAERAQDLLEAQGVEVEESADRPAEEPAAAAPTIASLAETQPGADEREVIPVVEERLKVGKRAVGRGDVRVYSRVTEQPVEEQVHLREERVRVERTPVDRPVSAADEAFRDRSIELTESAEEVVVAKEARVVEEIRIDKDVVDRTETVSDALRRTDVEVERTPPGGSEPPSAEHEADFRSHWRASLEGRGVPYDRSRMAYEYGTEIGADARYAGRDWATTEADVRRDWDRQHPGTWDQFQDAIHHAWDRVRGQRRAA